MIAYKLIIAFDQAVISNPPFEWVLHTASPFHYNFKDAEKELLEPGTFPVSAK
jgi:hypothetical protein